MTAIEDLNAQYDALGEDILAVEAEQASTVAALAAMTTQRNALQAQVATLQADLATMTTSRNALQAQVATLQAQVATLTAEVARLQAIIDGDTAAPSVPGRPTGDSLAVGAISITWTASTDASPPITYRVYRDGGATSVAQVNTTSFTDSGLAAGSSHTYQVDATDSEGNTSAKSPASSSIVVDSPVVPPVGGTLYGMGSFAPVNSSSELDAYRNKTKPQVFATIQAEVAAANGGRRMTAVRAFDGGFPATYAQHEAASLASSTVAAVISIKGDDAQFASGAMDSRITAFVNSIPATQKAYLIVNHERDNDSDALANPTTVLGVHMRAVARLAKVVRDSRGSKDIVGGCCPTGWNLQDQNDSYPYTVLNPSAALAAEGVSKNDFVFFNDSYCRKTPTAGRIAEIHTPIIRRIKSWGFTRIGFGEIAVDTYPTANRTGGGQYVTALAAMLNAEDIEVVCWYSSGGGNKAPAQGWWQYGAAKTAWAQAVAGA